MKTFSATAIFALVCFLTVSACSQTARVAGAGTQTADSLAFRIRSLTEEPWRLNPRLQRLPAQPANYDWLKDTATVKKNSSANIIGYRIQIFSSTNYYDAVRVRDEAAARFSVPVYLDHEVPFYKIRVGNFRDKDRADDLKETAKALGYPDAWIVQITIEEQE